MSSGTETGGTEFSDTLDVLDNTFKNTKYQKIKDILLEDIKKDVCDLIQNEIRQKNKSIQSRRTPNTRR